MVGGGEGPIHGERFFEKVESAKFGSANGSFNGGVPGDDDDLGGVGEGANFLQRVETIHAGQPDVEENHVERLLAEAIQAGLASRGTGGIVSFVPWSALPTVARIVHDGNTI